MSGSAAGAGSTEYNFDSHWISEAIDSGFLGLSHPLAVSIVKFSTVWNVVFGAYLLTQWSEMTRSFAAAWLLGLAWVNVAPALIWYYDQRVLPEFFGHLADVLPDESVRRELAEKYDGVFATHRLSVSAFWVVGLVAIVHVSRGFLRTQGMAGSGAVFLWATYALSVYIGGVLGQGFMGPVTTIRLIREVAEQDLDIDPLHPDGLGGLSTVGFCAIRTTLLFSTGSLYLPLIFQLSSGGGSTVVIVGFTSVYVLTILASFLYPTVKVNRRAQELRDGILQDLQQEYRRVREEMSGPDKGELAELNRRLELQRIQREFDTYNAVNLYPLQVSILTRLAGSVLLPLIFLLLELYLPNLL